MNKRNHRTVILERREANDVCHTFAPDFLLGKFPDHSTGRETFQFNKRAQKSVEIYY